MSAVSEVVQGRECVYQLMQANAKAVQSIIQPALAQLETFGSKMRQATHLYYANDKLKDVRDSSFRPVVQSPEFDLPYLPGDGMRLVSLTLLKRIFALRSQEYQRIQGIVNGLGALIPEGGRQNMLKAVDAFFQAKVKSGYSGDSYPLVVSAFLSNEPTSKEGGIDDVAQTCADMLRKNYLSIDCEPAPRLVKLLTKLAKGAMLSAPEKIESVKRKKQNQDVEYYNASMFSYERLCKEYSDPRNLSNKFQMQQKMKDTYDRLMLWASELKKNYPGINLTPLPALPFSVERVPLKATPAATPSVVQPRPLLPEIPASTPNEQLAKELNLPANKQATSWERLRNWICKIFNAIARFFKRLFNRAS